MTEEYATQKIPAVATYAATLTRCAGTWLEYAPDDAEQQRIDAASRALRQQRAQALLFYQDATEAHLFSIRLFRGEEFQPLHLSDHLVAQMLQAVGEPPEVENPDDPTFTRYLRQAVLSIASAQIRRTLAAQVRRFLPRYVEAHEWQKAIAIDNNALRTSLGNEVSPFLVQMTLEGLARWYENEDVG